MLRCVCHTSGVHLGINLRGGETELVLPQGGHNFHTELDEKGDGLQLPKQ